jgi:hypothetical protein
MYVIMAVPGDFTPFCIVFKSNVIISISSKQKFTVWIWIYWSDFLNGGFISGHRHFFQDPSKVPWYWIPVMSKFNFSFLKKIARTGERTRDLLILFITLPLSHSGSSNWNYLNIGFTCLGIGPQGPRLKPFKTSGLTSAALDIAAAELLPGEQCHDNTYSHT